MVEHNTPCPVKKLLNGLLARFTVAEDPTGVRAVGLTHTHTWKSRAIIKTGL